MVEQRQREREPPLVIPARAMPRGDAADLARPQRQAACVKRLAERQVHFAAAVPAHLEHGRLEPGQREGGLQAAIRGAGVDDQILLGGGRFRGMKVDAQRLPQETLALVDIDQLDVGTGQAGAEPGHQSADHASADDADSVADSRGGIPQGIERRFHVGAEDRALRRHVRRQRDDIVGTHAVMGLVWMQAVDVPAVPVVGSLLDDADVGVAVFDRPRELAALKRRAHSLVFADRHLALEDQGFTATADGRVAGSYHQVAADTQLGLANFAGTVAERPESMGVRRRH